MCILVLLCECMLAGGFVKGCISVCIVLLNIETNCCWYSSTVLICMYPVVWKLSVVIVQNNVNPICGTVSGLVE